MDTEDEWIEKVPDWVVAIAGVFFISLLLYIVVGGYMHGSARDRSPRYTIGYVTGTDYVVGPNSHSVAFFTYTVGNITYRQSSTGDVAAGCSRCLVKFAEADPTNFEFFNRVCVPDSITRAPAKGWEKPPFTAAGNAL
jgi:hypothetical protein